MINKSLSSKNPPSKVGWYFCEILLGGGAVDDFFNIQEDDPMIPSADFGDSKGRVYKLFKMMETLGLSGSWWKTSSFLF